MINQTTVSALIKHYPSLSDIQDESWKNVLQHMQVHHFQANEVLFHDGDECHWYFLLLKGSIRVQKNSANGHSIVLYHLNPGDACELTTLSLLARKHYAGEAIAESDIELITLSQNQFTQVLSRSSGFQQFVFAALEKGVSDLIHLIETIAFHHIDQRLAHYLINARDENNFINTTHQEISTELGTAREVVSRVLKSFEHHDYVELHRGRIALINIKKIEQIASEKLM